MTDGCIRPVQRRQLQRERGHCIFILMSHLQIIHMPADCHLLYIHHLICKAWIVRVNLETHVLQVTPQSLNGDGTACALARAMELRAHVSARTTDTHVSQRVVGLARREGGLALCPT